MSEIVPDSLSPHVDAVITCDLAIAGTLVSACGGTFFGLEMASPGGSGKLHPPPSWAWKAWSSPGL